MFYSWNIYQRIIILLVIAISFEVFFPNLVRAEENLVINGDFSSPDFSMWQKYSSANSIMVAGEAEVVGTKTGYESGITQEISIEANKTYQFSTKIRIEDPNVHGAILKIAWYPPSGPPQFEPTILIGEVSSGTSTISQNAKAPNGAATVQLRLYVRIKDKDQPGKAYYDDVQVRVVPDSTPTPTPSSSSTPTPQPSQNYNNLFIEEIYPEPGGDDEEWVEIANYNEFEVSLVDWYLKDEVDNKNNHTGQPLKNHKIQAKIDGKPGRVYIGVGKNYLNNDGDKVFLVYQSQIKDKVEDKYSKLSKDYSWSKLNGTWCRTKPSKGFGNNVCESATASPSDDDDEDEDSASPSPRVLGATSTAKSKTSATPEPTEDLPLPSLLASIEPTAVATVAGISTQMPTTQSKLLIPLLIAGSGLLLMSGAAYPFVQPKLAPAWQGLVGRLKKGS